MIQVEGGTLKPHTPYRSHGDETVQYHYTAITRTGESAEFMTLDAAKWWLAMDCEITESRAYRKGLRQ